MDDDAIRALLTRLSRPHRSGGVVVERAAVLAAGVDFTAVLRWIAEHDGQPEALAPVASARGLHSARLSDSSAREATPRRYVLPPGALA